jgi:hypothetical protein
VKPDLPGETLRWVVVDALNPPRYSRAVEAPVILPCPVLSPSEWIREAKGGAMNFSAVGLIVILILGILAAPRTSDAQQAVKVPRIGHLGLPRGDSPRAPVPGR